VTVDTPIYFSLDGLIAKVRAKNVERWVLGKARCLVTLIDS